MPISLSRRGAAEPFHAMDVLAEANRLAGKGHPVVSLAVGQPADPAPQPVRDAARVALERGVIGYTDAMGIAPLRAAISRHYGTKYNIEIPEARIAVTTGSSAGFNLAFLAMFDAGDRVATVLPGYPAYRNIMKALGLDVVEIAHEGAGYLTAAQLEAAHREKPLNGVLFASPANPTGAAIPENELRELVETASELGISVISDEIYHGLSFVGPDHTALAVDPHVVVINSFSKYYCMTGWRIGWMVLPESLVRRVECLQQSLYISAPALSQVAAVEAFAANVELEKVKARYRANRALLVKGLPELGFRIEAPLDGAFYAYCDVSRHSNDSMDFARRMLAECHVAITPGRDFDPAEGHRTVRLSYAGSSADMEEALARIARWLR
ncbi:aminotransferase class I/II-fold pyridoxal phosphate-dependent enzyme [Mesorhizobium sp. Z1-4]|uniref:pyridoxal phosphate-dependent aminotransferase n=1 Tax=Mesorhizobium sp. Z1-4 TaxID=2448478 RepID=UPI000FDAACD3|nr:aminotransferase class I/II-fold pyridoxal phosphate-dependent enzyme [Mesorhizobium sp. Z1-4]